MVEFKGVFYESVPEERNGYCIGCAADGNMELCKALQKNTHDYCSRNIFKKKETILDNIVEEFETNEEVKMKSITSLTNLMIEESLEILNRELKIEVKTEYDQYDVDSEIEACLDDIENEDIADLIRDNLDIGKDQRINFAETRIKESCFSLIDAVKAGKVGGHYEGMHQTPRCAKNILEGCLENHMVDSHLEKLEVYYMKQFYEDLDKNSHSAIAEMVTKAVQDVSEETIEIMVRKMIDTEVQDFIAEMFE